MQVNAVANDYDPMLGVMHYERDGSPAFAFDLMEPERPKVDRAVLKFLKSEALHPADFTIREDGVVRLYPELARRVAGCYSPLVQSGIKAALKRHYGDATVFTLLVSAAGRAACGRLCPTRGCS